MVNDIAAFLSLTFLPPFCVCLFLPSSHSLGIDETMARHVAHLFIRDPISLFAEKLEQDVESESDHFEVSVTSIQFLINCVGG